MTPRSLRSTCATGCRFRTVAEDPVEEIGVGGIDDVVFPDDKRILGSMHNFGDLLIVHAPAGALSALFQGLKRLAFEIRGVRVVQEQGGRRMGERARVGREIRPVHALHGMHRAGPVRGTFELVVDFLPVE